MKTALKLLLRIGVLILIFLLVSGYLADVQAKTMTIIYTMKPTRTTGVKTSKAFIKPDFKLTKSNASGLSLREEFEDVAKRVSEKEGFPFPVLFGQAILESGNFTSEYCVQRYNCFGYNAVDSNPDQATRFDTLNASIEAYIHLIKHNPLYSKAWRARKNIVLMLYEIKQAGYASDPDYVSKVISLPELQVYLTN